MACSCMGVGYRPKATHTFPMPETVTIRFSTLNENFASIKQLPLPPAVAGLAKMATSQDGKWVLESYSTQMVNCDRFAKFPKTDDSITYAVDHAKALVYLNFKDYNALLGPSTTRPDVTGRVHCRQLRRARGPKRWTV